jgi:hypothetical protein
MVCFLDGLLDALQVTHQKSELLLLLPLDRGLYVLQLAEDALRSLLDRIYGVVEWLPVIVI